MRNYEEFMRDISAPEMKKAFADFCGEKQPADEQEKLDMLVRFAAANGYEVTADQFGLNAATNRELDLDELADVTGGGNVFSGVNVSGFCTHLGADSLGSVNGERVLGGCQQCYFREKCSATVENNSWCFSDDYCNMVSSNYTRIGK